MLKGQDGLTLRCPQCKSSQLVKNGHNGRGTQQYRCKKCGKRTVLNPRILYPPRRGRGYLLRTTRILACVVSRAPSGWLDQR